MDGYDVKEVMEQVHISSQMQEEIIMNVKKRMENGNKGKKAWSLRKMATAAAAFVLAAGIVSLPVHAFVTSVVKERMESIPEEEIQGLNDMVQSQHDVLAEGFSREYSDSEKERSKELWQAYENGTFPENAIAQADNAEAAPEGALCYIRSTDVFNLPAQEMTDEEMLEIIDFQHKKSYAVEHEGGWTQEKLDEEERKDRAMLEEKVESAGGISEDEAIAIATKAMEADLGEKAEEMEICIWPEVESFGWKLRLWDITDWAEYKDKGDIAYSVDFNNAQNIENPEDYLNYQCFVNAVDGSICGAYSINMDLDEHSVVWYEH